MSKFNKEATIKTTNKAGHVAYSMENKEKLASQVLTSFFDEKKFYGDNTADMQRTIVKTIAEDPKFVSNLAVMARRVFNMRSVAHVLAAYLAHEVEGKPYARATIRGVSLRGDDVTEIMAFYMQKFGKPLPNSLRRGIADVISGMDEYQLAKYSGSGNDVKMKDTIKLCRPKPADDEKADLFRRCIEDRLETPVTWETELSKNGNNAETWERLIEGGNVGYMAMLRNFRNIIEANPANIEKVYRKLQDPEAVRRSKQLPFRYLSAYSSIMEIASKKHIDVLENAMDAAVWNVKEIPGKTVVAVDISGSMACCVSGKSYTRYSDIAMTLAAIANRVCEDCEMFAFNDALYKLQASSRDGILSFVKDKARCSGGTDMRLPFIYMRQQHIEADRVIVVSDNVCNASSSKVTMQSFVDAYRRDTGNGIWVHAIDVAGYGTQQFYGNRVNVIAGWSERVLDFVLMAEQGMGGLVKAIEDYVW